MGQGIQFWTVAIGCMDIVLLAAVVHFVISDIRQAQQKRSARCRVRSRPLQGGQT